MQPERLTRPLPERFWAKVDKNGPVHPVLGTACWLWTGAKDRLGYGSIGVGRRGAGTELAHRVTYELVVGPIPDGLGVLHRCDVPSCVRAEHLFLGTRADNNRDMHEKRRNRQPKGEAAGNAKLTEDQVREVFRLRGLGTTGTEIARRLGVANSTVYRILSGELWRSVVRVA